MTTKLHAELQPGANTLTNAPAAAAPAHTPGPWETSVLSDGTEWTVCAAGGGDMIADLCGCDDAEANARLIAAAPELLAALRDMVEHARRAGWDELPPLQDRPQLLARAEAALAKVQP